jgi:hypothetical protein
MGLVILGQVLTTMVLVVRRLYMSVLVVGCQWGLVLGNKMGTT